MNFKKISIFGSLLISCILCSCISSGAININRDIGFAEQRQLVEKYSGMTAPELLPNFHNSKVLIASSIGFDLYDSTAILQQCFDSDAEVILVPRMNDPWITKPLFIRRPMTVIFEEGAVLEAKRGEYMDNGASLLTIQNTADVSLYGYGARLHMYKEDYRKPPYEKGEWRATINILGSKDILIAGIHAENSGGDGIYIGPVTAKKINQNICIKDVILKNHYRQGISVISVDSLLIENSLIMDTEGTPPSAGIDFEPDSKDHVIKNVLVRNCIVEGNSGAGIQGYFIFLSKESQPFDITIERCKISRNLVSVFFLGFEKGARGTVTFKGNDIRGISIIPQIPDRLKIIRKN